MTKHIIISHKNFINKFPDNCNWVYIGRDYTQVIYFNKKFGSKNRILLAQKFRNNFEKERLVFLEWIENQRKKKCTFLDVIVVEEVRQ